MDGLVTTKQVAIPLHTTESGIRWQISTGTGVGPLFRKFGKRWLARSADIEAYIAAAFGDAA